MSINFESLFLHHGVRFSTSGPNLSRGWIGTNCPHCGDRSDHLGWNSDSGACSCWKCGKHPMIPTLGLLLGLEYREVAALLVGYRAGLHRQSYEEFKGSSKEIILPKRLFTSKEREYLDSRGFTDKHVQYADIRGGGITGEWAFRIVIPLVIQRRIVGATGRAIVPGMEPRYRNLPKQDQIIEMKSTFLGLDNAGSTPVVVEGPFDAIKGGPGFISGFGASLTSKQLLVLSRFKKVYFLFDNDSVGRAKSLQWAAEVSMIGVDTEILAIDNGTKDLGGSPESLIKEIRSELGFGGSW